MSIYPANRDFLNNYYIKDISIVSHLVVDMQFRKIKLLWSNFRAFCCEEACLTHNTDYKF